MEFGLWKMASPGFFLQIPWLVVGARSNRELMDALGNAKVEVYDIGDCVTPRKIAQANSQGFDVGIGL